MNVGGTALWLVPLAIVARGAGFAVPIILAGWFGVTPLTDAFFFALSVPSFLLVLASNAMGTVAVPPLAELRHKAPERLPVVVSGAALASAGLALAVGTSFAIVLPHLLPHVASFDAATQAAAVRHTWMLLPFVAAVAAGAVVRAATEVMGAFRLAGLGPVFRAGAVLGTVWALRPWGEDALPLGMSAGALSELLWLSGVLASRGVWLVRPGWPAELAATAGAVLPVLLGEAMVALNLVVDKAFASGLGEGSVSLLEYADRARLIPQTLLEASLLVVAFNAWSAARARGDTGGQAAGIRQALRWVFLLAPPALAGMVVAREAMVRLLFARGAFPESGVLLCANTLAAFVPGVFASLVGALLVKAHVVNGRFGLVLRLGAVSLCLNLLLNVLLAGPFGLVGLAVSTSVTTVVVTALSWWQLREPSGRPPALPRDGAAVLALAALGAVAFGTQSFPSVFDLRLWLAALPFLALLAFGGWRARQAG